MRLVIRADGGPDIGYGHLVRTGALAEVVCDRGHAVTYATTTPDNISVVCPDEVDVVSLPARGDPEPFVEWLETAGPDAVFTDSYPVDTAYQRAVRERCPLAVFQDDDRHAVCADVFVNGNLYAPDLAYQFVGSDPRTCLGAGYALLRTEIRRLAASEPPWRSEASRALVTMGGSDIAGLTPTVIRAFDGFDGRVDAIIGPGFSDEQARSIRTAATNVSADVRLARNPDDLPERMFQADFAVSTASSTTYELHALGTPIISVPVAANQEPIANALRKRDAATVLDGDPDQAAFRDAIDAYVSDHTLRRRRRATGRELVDGRGNIRVADVLLDAFADENP